jgi:type II secretory pathway pseudopilin PulG
MTLLELTLVLALLLILAAATLPSFDALKGNTRQKAAADLIRARLADARAKAVEDGQAYRLAFHQDGTRVRVAPDGPDFGTRPADHPGSLASRATEDTLVEATAHVTNDSPDATDPDIDPAGWVTVATCLPDGTCREASVIIDVREKKFPPIRIHVRGVTGSSKVLSANPNAPGQGGGKAVNPGGRP